VNKIRNKSVKKVSPVGESTSPSEAVYGGRSPNFDSNLKRGATAPLVGEKENDYRMTEQTCVLCTSCAIYHSLDFPEDELYEEEEELWDDGEELWDDGEEV